MNDVMKAPIIVLNFKNYAQTREKSEELVKICKRVSEKYGLNIISCVPALNLEECADEGIVFAQHFDAKEDGAFTGAITVTGIKQEGAKGSLINHSEKRIGMENVKACIELAKKHGLVSICCVENLQEAKQVMEWGPDMLAYEDKELIGSGKSIAEFQADKVKEFVSLTDKCVPLAGAGISNEKDVLDALNLGTKGVLLASAFVKSDDPEGFLVKIAEALKGNGLI